MSAIHPSRLSFFSAHAPFDRMDTAHLLWMLDHMQLAYYPEGEIILSPESGVAARFLVIKQGQVLGELVKDSAADAWLELSEGECFPLGALLARRPVANLYRSLKDTFCYEMSSADFHGLLELSAPFRDFCTRRINHLLDHSMQVIQTHYIHAGQQSLNTPLSAIITSTPVTCPANSSVREALMRMHEARVESMIAVDENNHPLGILTLPDVLARVALPQIDLELPVIEVMTTRLICLPPEALAYEAAITMAKLGFRHILVVEAQKLIGQVTEKDLFSLQRTGLRQLGDAIRCAKNTEALQLSAGDIRNMAHNMMAQGITSEHITQFISTFNDLLTVRVIELAYLASSVSDLSLCWLALGSEGRFEQTLNTDQDNALIFSVPDGRTADSVREQILPVAHRINETLALCGFPLCTGNVMASNPAWCLSKEEWRERFLNWIVHGTPLSLLHASIFFDFRALHGASELAYELRLWLSRVAADQPRFLHQMAENAVRNRPPLGVVRDFIVGHEHTLDLKVNGITPFVDAARIFSLATGGAATGTIARLRESAAALHVSQASVEGWIDAFLFIQMLRLRHHEDARQTDKLDNLIDPASLNELDRRILKEAFRQARKVQAKLAQIYQL